MIRLGMLSPNPLVLLLLLLGLSCAHRIPVDHRQEVTARYGQKATPLSQDFSYFQRPESGTQFWKIMPYYKPQLTDCSCSTASAALLLNALMPTHRLSDEVPSFTEERVLALSESSSWKEATKTGSTGLTLQAFHREIQNLFKKLNVTQKFSSQYFEMKTEEDSRRFKKHLLDFNQSKGWLIVMYGQGTVLGGPVAYPHFSPVGAYDEKQDRLLVLDIDGTWYEPYWLPTESVIKNMSLFDEEMKCQRGYLFVSLL